jgi:hypothetical protein
LKDLKVLAWALLLIVAIPVAAGFAWLSAIWVADYYKLGWVEVPVHYKLTFAVEVGGTRYTGSTVAQVLYQHIPHWQALFGPGVAFPYKGQAGCTKLEDGKLVCLLPGGQYLVVSKDKYYPGVGALANRLLSVDGSPTGLNSKSQVILPSNARTVTGSSDVPIELLPPMIVLDRPADPTSAHLLDPEHPERALGAGARFLGVKIAVTNEPVSQGIETVLPWLAPSGSTILSLPGDPFLEENSGRPLYRAYFF